MSGFQFFERHEIILEVTMRQDSETLPARQRGPEAHPGTVATQLCAK